LSDKVVDKETFLAPFLSFVSAHRVSRHENIEDGGKPPTCLVGSGTTSQQSLAEHIEYREYSGNEDELTRTWKFTKSKNATCVVQLGIRRGCTAKRGTILEC